MYGCSTREQDACIFILHRIYELSTSVQSDILFGGYFKYNIKEVKNNMLSKEINLPKMILFDYGSDAIEINDTEVNIKYSMGDDSKLKMKINDCQTV